MPVSPSEHAWCFSALVWRRLRLLVWSFALAAGLSRGVSAQDFFAEPPMTGPLLAATTAAHDRILLYDLSDDTRRELSFGPGEHHVWGFSPDGCRLLYTLSRGAEPPRAYSATLGGNDVRALVAYDDLPAEDWGVWEPQWSPDGERIVFTMMRDLADQPTVVPRVDIGTKEYRVAWVPPEGGAPTFYSVSGDEHSPQWSPTGEWLAYISYEERVIGADYSSTAVPTAEPPPGQAVPSLPMVREADLWIVSADGQSKFRLTYFDTGSVSGPRWSPDGQLIGFTYAPIPNNDQFWMIAPRGGSIPTQLSAQWVLNLDMTWLPDSSAMLSAARDVQGVAENRLWRIPLVGLADTEATQYVSDPALAYADYPRFSADGAWLALRSAYGLALVETGTGTWRRLDVGTLGNTPPAWSPAGFAGEAACREAA